MRPRTAPVAPGRSEPSPVQAAHRRLGESRSTACGPPSGVLLGGAHYQRATRFELQITFVLDDRHVHPPRRTWAVEHIRHSRGHVNPIPGEDGAFVFEALLGMEQAL